MTDELFRPLRIGPLHMDHRILMAPLTRQRADRGGDVPNALMREYYVQRASAGLIVTEGTQVSQQGKGYVGTPGIHAAEQVAGWRSITEGVHRAGGLIAAQLFHAGRVSHPSLHNGELPVSASAVPFRCRTTIGDSEGGLVRVNCPTPRALTVAEIREVVADFAAATTNARAAGFDLVEIHGAHGYLLHQFLAADANVRDDQYGGHLADRARLLLEVVDAVVDAWDADHVGLRISPIGTFNGLHDPDGENAGLYLAAELERRNIAYLHLSEPDWAGGPQLENDYRQRLRRSFSGVLIGAGNYDAAKARDLIAAGLIDAAAFGRTFIANPDLPQRLRDAAPLNAPDKATFYGGNAHGYTDYPVLADHAVSRPLRPNDAVM